MMVFEDSDDVFDSLFVFMAKSYDKEDEEVKLHNIKQNLNNYFMKKLKDLETVLIDSLVELTNKKDLWGKILEVSKY